jgi:Ca2+-transporting ATPase
VNENPSKPNVYNLEIGEVLKGFQTSVHGLTHEEVARRQQEFGPNALKGKKQSLFKRIIEPFSSMFVLVLLVALVLSIVEHKSADAIVIGVIVFVNAIIFYVQQISVSRVLKTLKAQDVSMVDAIRAGKTIRVASEELTLGDIVHVVEGAKVPADGRLIEANQVQCDESVLTGESLPVRKHAAAIAGDHALYEQTNMLFKGSYVKSGSGLMVVAAIGDNTQLGGINTLASSVGIVRSPIEEKIDDFTRKLMIAIIVCAAIAVWLATLRGTTLEEAFRFSLTLVVSAVPEGLPVALTIVLLLSARRMAKVHALVKKISSIETMGAITLIATDKTGTITQNKLSIADTLTVHRSEKSFHEVIRATINGTEDHPSDPLDTILIDAVRHIVLPASWHKQKDFAFNQQLRMSAVLWRHGRGYTLYVKGAPEQVIAACRPHDAIRERDTGLEEFTRRGYRTIAFAHKDFAELPKHLDKQALQNMHFDGFVGMADELRPHIAEAIATAQQAGIKVVMLTGDHIATAGHIAQQVGIAQNTQQVSDSGVLANGNPEDIRAALQETRVFGRVLPEHKYALLKATRGHEITAMTGDGVNDIPALVQADTGLAMGSGTDAAKDASDIVLMDDNFHTIVNAIRAGRTALTNIRKMLVYLLSTSSGEVLTMLCALIFGLPLPVTAIQILWVNLVTDSVTVIPLGLSPEEPHSMREKPRNPRAALLNKRMVLRIVMMSLSIAVTVLLVFKMNLDKGLAVAQSLAFLSLVVIQWANALTSNFEYKSWVYNFVHPNKKLLLAIGFSVALQTIMYMTPLGRFLGIVALDVKDVAIAVVVPLVVAFTMSDIHRLIANRFMRSA